MFLVQDTSKYFFYQTLLAYDFEGIKTSADLQAVRAQELLGESLLHRNLPPKTKNISGS
jgi:hypothetical protein